MPRTWSKQVIWGNHRITGGVIRPNANAFQLGTTWGAALDRRRRQHRLGHVAQERWRQPGVGTADLSEDNWSGAPCATRTATTWSAARPLGDNLWGTLRRRQHRVGHRLRRWRLRQPGVGNSIAGDNLVWGTSLSADNLVWGTAALGDNLVWGTSGDVDNLVWGTPARTTT